MSLRMGLQAKWGPRGEQVSPTRCPRSDPGTCESLTFHGKRDFADVIKSRTSRWRKCSGLFTRPEQNMGSVQFSSVAQSCPTLCDPMDCSTTGLPVHHQLPEFTQTHVHRVSDAVQPSHPLLALSPPAGLQPFPTVARGDVTTEDSGYGDTTPLASKMEQGGHQQRKVGASRTWHRRGYKSPSLEPPGRNQSC